MRRGILKGMERQTSIRLWSLRTLIGFFIYIALVLVGAYFAADYLTEQGMDRYEKKAIIAPFILVAILIYCAAASAFPREKKTPHRFTDE
jgi:membrane protein DedA with SNARE-associated domain